MVSRTTWGEIPISAFLKYPTIKELAKYIVSQELFGCIKSNTVDEPRSVKTGNGNKMLNMILQSIYSGKVSPEEAILLQKNLLIIQGSNVNWIFKKCMS